MSGAIRVLLPASAAHLATLVQQAGCIAVIDATSGPLPEVPDGAWVRTRPGRPAPGNGPVILAEFGAPLPDRETWLETTAARAVPKGYAGLVLKGREAGGLCGEMDGLEALAACPEPGRVLLDAGVGPRGAGAAAALGAAGVLLVDTWLACPEVALPPSMEHRLDLPDDEITQVVAGLRVGNSATAPVLRALATGGDPWSLAEDVYGTGDLKEKLWMIGQGAALARGLADRHGTLSGLLQAYADHWKGWRELARQSVAVDDAVPVHTTHALAQPGTAASTGGVVGSAVLWEMAGWLGRPVHGGPAAAAVAIGNGVVGDAAFVAKALGDLCLDAPVAAVDTPAPVVIGGRAPAIAIIGIGCRFPGADSLDEYWSNILNGVNSIGQVPSDRWDPALYFDANADVPDKTYSKIGAFLSEQKFNSKRFRIPPKVVSQIDPVQQITLTCVADALDDANLKVDKRSNGREFNRERCAVILGNSLGGEVGDEYAIRLNWHSVKQQITDLAAVGDLDAATRDAMLVEMETAYLKDLPIINEDSMPGELANVIAGRIANAFDLGGANFTVDAACASSMAALQSSMRSLQSGDSDLVVTGGTDRSMNIATYVKFCKIGALSPDHSSPFDQSANGFVMGEGCGILVLKRYEDAVRDGDKIYSVIRGIGASSDGKGKGITAPNIKGQLRALERAYEAAGFGPHEVDLMECHGTSTVVGDKVEVEALNTVIGPGKRGERGPIRIGSVKSMIGHLKSAAGAASCIKAALALHHGVLPPSIGFKKAREDVPFDTVPLQVQTHAEPWPQTSNGLRRAGISAFGFGGTNFHIVMESYAGQVLPVSALQSKTTPQPPAASLPAVQAPVMLPPPSIVVQRPAMAPSMGPALPEGVWATSGVDRTELLANLKLLAAGKSAPFQPSAPVRIAAASRDAEERESQLKRAIKSLEKNGNPDMLRARAIHLEEQAFDGKVALLFTGQGSQYLDMGLDLAEAYPIVADTFAEADRILAPTLGRPITDFIRLRPGEDKAAKSDVLRQTEYSQPATLTLDIAILRLLASYGVSPDLVAGHSLGEYGAAVAAGVMTFEQALMAVSARGREMANIRLDDPGKMAGIAASTEVVEAVLAEVDGYVIAANKNCPSQTVIAGASDAVEEASERFKARGVTVYPLPVSHAFHSEIVAPASEPLRGVLAKLGLQPPRRPITTNVTGEYYPTGPDAVPKIIDLLAQQISAPVEWVAQMERMYEDGARVFIEVGPKRALAGFTVAILKRRPHRALYTNHPKRGGVASFRDSLAGLLAFGFSISADPAPGPVDLFAPALPRLATSDAVGAFAFDARPETAHEAPLHDIHQGVLQIVADATGYELEELELDYELEADLGIDTVKQAEIFSAVRTAWSIPEDADFDMSQNRTLGAVIAWASSRVGGSRFVAGPAAAVTPPPAPVVAAPAPVAPIMGQEAMAKFLKDAAQAGMSGSDADGFARAMLPAVQGLLAAAFAAAIDARPAPATAPVALPTPVVSTASVMLPGSVVHASLETVVVCSGASVGLPGGTEVFSPRNFTDILSGQNRISHIGDRADRFLEKGIVRLVKDSQTGQGSFLPVEDVTQVIRLAGLKAHFDLTEYGVAENYLRALDITTQLAFAAGIEALRDAGIPLVRDYKLSASGKRVPQGWRLPKGLRDGTGVIFACAFPGYDQMVKSLLSNGDDGEGHFDRRFLFQVLSMGHSQFAQFIGARGPNAAVNAACASTTQALALADDWLRLGRCERVVVVGADDVTSENLLPWIGSGFMAAGAATTHDVVEEAALPFDRRRHGMILGMGAVGLVLERATGAAERGIVPIAELAGALTVNSAFHGTRLDTEHISNNVKRLVDQVCERKGVTPGQIADSAFFVSHETYTPARGGSAAAEIGALKAAFGDKSTQIIIANTKGFTGHAMGAGIEDAVAVKALQYGLIPPVANLREPDPDLGPLRLSRGERISTEWCVRLAAGFGSQLAVSIWRRIASGDNRVADEARRVSWLKANTGYGFVEEVVQQRTLRVVEGTANALLPLVPEISPANTVVFETDTQAPVVPPVVVVAPTPAAAPMPAAAPPEPVIDNVIPMVPVGEPRSFEQVLAELTAVIAEKTGYEPDELEADFELEADLGIDTVKQAEILSDLTDRYGLARDDDFKMADYPTIEALAAYLVSMLGVSPTTPTPLVEPVPAAPAPVDSPVSVEVSAPTPAAEVPIQGLSAVEDVPEPVAMGIVASSAAVIEPTLPQLIAVVAEKTGYEPEELESDFELEADLGVDTVKQAEIISALQEHYQLPPDDDFSLADHPTLGELASYLDGRRALVSGGSVAPAPVVEAEQPQKSSGPATGVQPSTGREWVAEEFDLRPLLTDEQALEGADEPVEDAKAPDASALPDSFRIRRPLLVERPVQAKESLNDRRILILGEGTLVEAIRDEISLRGGATEGPFDTVLDVADDVKISFAKAKSLESDRPHTWLTLTRLGDFAGIYPLDRAFVDGARAGFTKSLGREWEGTQAKVVDVPASDLDANVARFFCDELGTDAATEVWQREGTRRVIEYRVEQPPVPGVIDGDAVVLITGGGRGICARIAAELADRGSVRLGLVGRGPAGEQVLDEKAEKARIKAELKAAGERGTPAQINQQLNPLRKAEEIRLTLEGIRAKGREVVYFQADVADPKAVVELVERVEAELGPIAYCIHGAGAEESRLIQDKDDVAFHRVFDGKAIGGQALIGALPEGCFFVSMGSVAGRFGNPGQVDYAAANDAMARICLTRPHALHVDWTAWDDVGMAARGGMKHLLQERGVDMLPADAGAALLVNMMAARVTGEVVVAGGLGDFLPAPGHPLLDRVEMEGDVVRAFHELTLKNDPWILDHSIDGTAVLPGVIGLEMMAAAAALVVPGKDYSGARNVRFNAPVKVHGDRVTDVVVEAEPTPRANEVRARLISVRTLRTGRVTRTEHFSATLLFGDAVVTDSLPSAFMPDEPVTQGEVYKRFFHGPIFQVLRQVFGVSEDGLVAEAAVEPGNIADGLITEPLVLESAFQAAGLHQMITADRSGLPMEIDQVVVLSHAGVGEPYSLTVRLCGEHYDIDVDGPGGPLMRIRGFRLIERGPLPAGDRFPTPEGGRPQCFPPPNGVVPSGDGRTSARATSTDDPESWLTSSELDSLRSRGTERRVRDRIAGRIAAKRALQLLTGVAPLDMEIYSAESGEPMVVVPQWPRARVSISHRDGVGIAVAVDGGRIGVDLELVEARPEHFAQTWFSDSERLLCGDDPVRQTALWSVKEAVLKVLGTGMALSPKEILVQSLADGRALIGLQGAAARRLASLGGGRIAVCWTVSNDASLVAEARIAA